MSEIDILNWLPPGWTKERFDNATDKDIESLTEEQFELVMKRSAAEAEIQAQKNIDRINAKRAARGTKPIQETQRERDAAGAPFVQLVESKGWDDWGFVLIRMDYGDDERWAQYLEKFDEILESGMDQADASTGIERIREKALTKIVDDDILQDTGVPGAASAFHECKLQDDVEPGLSEKVCLMADAESIASVLDEMTGTPFIKVVAATFDHEAEEGYDGSFKVAVTALMAKLYPALLECGDPSELAAFADPIWQDTFAGQ